MIVDSVARWVAAGLLSACFAAVAGAEEFVIVGPRAMGMGGAGVAVTRGGLSSYWNPAGLAPPHSPRVDSTWDISIPFSAQYTASENALGEIDDLVELVEDIDFDQLAADLAAGNLLSSEQVREILRLAEEIPDLEARGTGLLTSASLGLSARLDSFSFSALGILYAGGVTNVDLAGLALGNTGLGGVLAPTGGTPATPAGHQLASSLVAQGLATPAQADEIVFQAEQAGVNVANPQFQQLLGEILEVTRDNLGGSLDNLFSANQSGVDVRGMLLQEYGVGYAHPFLSIFSVGLTAKLLYGTTYFEPFELRAIGDLDDILEELTDGENREESLNFGLDLGILVQPLDWLAIGLVARNINQPEFDFEGPGNYTVDPQLRGGIGAQPVEGLTLALDLDLLKNESDALPGFESQVIGGGIEYALLDVLFLRLGASKNLADEKEEPVIHGGLGFRIPPVQIDLAAMVSTDFTEIETSRDGDADDLPERAGAAIMIGINVPLP